VAIAFNNAAYGGNNSGTTNSFTFSYACGSGANRLLVVVVLGDTTSAHGGTGFDDITGVTYNGVSMTLAVKKVTAPGGSDRFSYIYFLLNPASGANNVVISCTNNHFLFGGAADYTGVAQSGQPDATQVDAGSGSVSTFTSSITTIADNSWAILLEEGYDTNNDDLPPIAGTGVTRRAFESTYGAFGLFDSNGAITPPAAYSMTTTRSTASNTINHIKASFAPVGASAFDMCSRTMCLLP
jgi:hypothetical protein